MSNIEDKYTIEIKSEFFGNNTEDILLRDIPTRIEQLEQLWSTEAINSYQIKCNNMNMSPSDIYNKIRSYGDEVIIFNERQRDA